MDKVKGKGDVNQKKRLVTSLFVVGGFVLFLLYNNGFFGNRENSGASSFEYGTKSVRAFGWANDEENDHLSKQEELPLFGQDESESNFIPKSYPVCDDRHSELIPCLDRNHITQMRLKLDLSLMEHYERHCPLPERRFNCLIPPPHGYKVPIKWPKSRDEVWQANIPHTHLAHEKSDQNWMVVKGDKIEFPGGGTHFHYGADKYIASLANMLNFTGDNLSNEGRIRTVLDVGCGVASFGGYLLSSDIIAMSLAPNDVHQNQIQFALERGIPAYLGVLGTKRLPYPSRSFELAHCSRCRIDWLQRDGILLLELDRLLRPGGYFAYSSPEAYATDEEDLRIWREMSALVERMCWKIAAKRNQTVIWVKPLTNDCYMSREPGTQPPMCKSDDDPDSVWGVPMQACITSYPAENQRAKGSGLAPWPERLTTPPPRLASLDVSSEMFEKDTALWQKRVDKYWDLLSPKISPSTLRNIMDMRAHLGSFAAALRRRDVWVMNVVPEDEQHHLKVVYDRGLIGSVHDWCEAYSTYPRTYDLLHAWEVVSEVGKRGCSPEDLLLEMDRILRPTGFALFRDRRPALLRRGSAADVRSPAVAASLAVDPSATAAGGLTGGSYLSLLSRRFSAGSGEGKDSGWDKAWKGDGGGRPGTGEGGGDGGGGGGGRGLVPDLGWDEASSWSTGLTEDHFDGKAVGRRREAWEEVASAREEEAEEDILETVERDNRKGKEFVDGWGSRMKETVELLKQVREPGARGSYLKDSEKAEMYRLHKENPEVYTVERLAKDYRIMRQRVHAILWLKEIEEEEERKLGRPLDDSVEQLLDACPEFFISHDREFHVASLPYKADFKVMPEDWDGTARDPDEVHYEISKREDEILYREFVQRMNFNKMKMAGQVKCHKYSRRRPAEGWNFTVEKLGQKDKRPGGGGGGWRFVSQPDGSSRPLNSTEKMYAKRETVRRRRRILP